MRRRPREGAVEIVSFVESQAFVNLVLATVDRCDFFFGVSVLYSSPAERIWCAGYGPYEGICGGFSVCSRTYFVMMFSSCPWARHTFYRPGGRPCWCGLILFFWLVVLWYLPFIPTTHPRPRTVPGAQSESDSPVSTESCSGVKSVIVCDLFVNAFGYVRPSCAALDLLCRAPIRSGSCTATAFFVCFLCRDYILVCAGSQEDPEMLTLCSCGVNKTFFHYSCLLQWLAKHSYCPACR